MFTINTIMNKYGEFTQLNTKLYNQGNNGKSPGYTDMVEIASNYFNYMEKFEDTIFMETRNKYGYSGKYQNYFNKMWKPEERLFAPVKKRLLNPNDKGVTAQTIELNPREHTYLWRKDSASPFTEGVRRNTGQNKPFEEGGRYGVAGGERGNVTERMYWNIKEQDPLRYKYQKNTFLAGDEMARLDEISRLMSSNSDWATTEMQQLIPKAFKDVKKGVASIQYLKRSLGYVINNPKIPDRVKQKRIEGINKSIKNLEKNL